MEMTTTTTHPAMLDRDAEPTGYLVHTKTARTHRYVHAATPTGRGLVVTDDRTLAYRFATEDEARTVARLAAQQYRGTWGVTILRPRRQPTATPDEIAARVAARRADRKRNG